MNKKIFIILNFIVILLSTIFTIINSYFIFKENLLNFKYINYIIILFSFSIVILLSFLAIKYKHKVFPIVLSFIFLISSYFGYSKINSIVNMVNKMNDNANVIEYSMSVIVKKDSDINDINDLKDITISAPINFDEENIKELTNDIKTNKNIDLNIENIENYVTAYQNLLAENTKAIILNSSYENIIELADKDYSNKIKKIYEIKISKNTTNTTKINSSNILNIYISGIDTYGAITSVSRSDVNIIMSINKNTNKILLTTTPRDSYVKIAGGGNDQYDKLTHAGIYGIESSVVTLENLYDINIDYYVRINFTSFLKLIDLVGGVEVYNEQEFTSLHGNYYFPVGMVELDAKKALGFVRERYSLSGGDGDRGKNQQKVIVAIINKLTTINSIKNYEEIINELSSSIQTNMPLSEIMKLANDQIDTKAKYKVSSQALEGVGIMGMPSYAMPSYNLYMLKIDDTSLETNKKSIKNVLEGK